MIDLQRAAGQEGFGDRPDVPDRRGPILLVDDEPYVLRWLSWHLSREGYVVATASNGETGLARARELHPPLIFLDARLPVMDGYTVCEEIRRDPTLAGTHVILLSASEPPAPGERRWRGGAPDEYLAKPCRPGEVTRRARAVLGAPDRQRAA
jgi:two-component system alkaline phosphatase synthesis response regulator PhoP